MYKYDVTIEKKILVRKHNLKEGCTGTKRGEKVGSPVKHRSMVLINYAPVTLVPIQSSICKFNTVVGIH